MKTTLTAFLHGQEIASLLLEAGQEYIIGRGSSCSIQLPNEKGISRQHIKISQQAEVWVAELLSKTGSLILEGENVSAIELSGECRFSIPPIEFDFKIDNEEPAVQDEEISYEDVAPAEELESEPLLADITASKIENLSHDNVEVTEDPLDSTMAGVVQLVPMLRVVNEKSGEEYSLKLDGHIWTAGRHPECEIHINENAISRRHFEISLIGNSYGIKDLGSSNGTHVNGKALEPNEISELASGDKISIRHLSIHFEVRDKNHEQKMAAVKELAIVEPDAYMGPAVIKMDAPEGETGLLANPKVKKALMVGAPLLLVIAMYAGGGEDKKDLPSQSESAEKVASPEDIEEAKHLLEVARDHYQNQNFSFCLIQLQKLHGIVPSYDDSKDMESLCEQAIDLEREQADRDAIEKSRQEAQAKIQNIIDNCQSAQTDSTTSAEMQICLQPALELSPEEPRALSLISELEFKESQEQNAEALERQRQARIRSGKAAYSKAVKLEKQKRLKRAKAQYYKFIRGRYGLQAEEAKARRAIASIDRSLNAKVMSSVQACEKLLSESKYRDAIIQCNTALKIDNDNSKAIAAKNTVLKRLRIDMKKIWDNSVLEESFGNIEAAKARWKEIVEKSVPRENYYEKASNKLKTYGIE